MSDSNYCELCNAEGTPENPVRYFYDLAALVCSECIDEYFEFAEAKAEDE